MINFKNFKANLNQFYPKFHSKNNFVLFGIITTIVFGLDQLLKYLIVAFNVNYNWGLFTIHLVKNTGAGFGVLKGQTILLGLFSLIVMVLILGYYFLIPLERKWQILFALFFSGVMGNFVDRWLRSYVVDFIDFHFWPAFNLADMMITVSMIGLVFYLWER